MNEKKTHFIQTFTGTKFYPLEPDIELIDIRDIAHALSLLCRYGGHCKHHYSVGQHSLNCLEVARKRGLSYQERFTALMHDASEGYLVDVPRPIKNEMSDFIMYEDKLHELIAKKFGLIFPHPQSVVEIDDGILTIERKNLFENYYCPSMTKEDNSSDFEVSNLSLRPTKEVEEEFLREFYNFESLKEH